MEIGQIMLRSVSLKPIVGYSRSKESVASGSENSEILLSHIGSLSKFDHCLTLNGVM